jgi:mannitol/fructose-specific phosphotransferase system IIA component (Ntr-type)
MLLKALETREQAGATLVAPGIAMPHCRSILMEDFVIVLGRSAEGIAWPSERANIVIMFISPVKPSGPQEHMDLIAHLATNMKQNSSEKLTGADSPARLAELLGLELI